MEKIEQKKGSDYLEGEILRSRDRLRLQWPDGTVENVIVAVVSGRACIFTRHHGVEIMIPLQEEGLLAERT